MEPNAQVELIRSNGSGFSASGSVAARLLASGFDVNGLRTNNTLRKDEWILLDTAVVEIARKRLRAVADLLSRGLRFAIANALGITRLEWERESDMTEAEMNMSGISVSEGDRLTYDLTGMPLPIVYKDFNLNVRALSASRRMGTPLDTRQVEVATRKVVEYIENMVFNGSTALGSNNTIYGYRTATNRNTGSITSGGFDSASGTSIIGNVLDMMQASIDDFHYGPWVLYLPMDAASNLADDFKTESDRTIMERILAIPGIEAVNFSHDIPTDNALLVEMTRETVDMVDGIQPTLVEWETHGGMVFNFKVMAIMVPRVRQGDMDTHSGIVHFS